MRGRGVGREPGNWGVVGDSTGGYCALKLAMDHPGVYAAGAGLPAPDTSLLVSSGKAGESNYKDTLKFIARVKATKLTQISSIILESGGHNFHTWQREIPATLQWMSGRLRAG